MAAEANASAEDVVEALAAQVGFLTKQNAILEARLKDALRQLDSEPTPDVHDVTTLPPPP